MTFDDVMATMARLRDAIICAQIERLEARRVVLVPDPANAVQLDAWLVAYGLDDVITVRHSPYLPPGSWVVIDPRAIEAAGAEAAQAAARRLRAAEAAARHPVCLAAAPMWCVPIVIPPVVFQIRIVTT